MQPQDAHLVGEVVEFDGQPLPQMHPGGEVAVEQLGEPAEPRQRALRVDAGFGRGDVASGVDRDHLLHRHRLTGRQLHRDVVTDFGIPGKQPTSRRDGRAVTAHGVSRGHGDRDAGLSGLHGQQDRIVREFACLRGPEMLVGQVPIALDQGVRHVAVQGRAELDGP